MNKHNQQRIRQLLLVKVIASCVVKVLGLALTLEKRNTKPDIKPDKRNYLKDSYKR